VQDILCGPVSTDLPEESVTRIRLLTQAKKNRVELVNMIDSIMANKEEDERKDEAYYRQLEQGYSALTPTRANTIR